MKKADLEKLQAMKIAGRMQQEPHSERYGTASGQVFDKREQRERDKAAGLVPFAVKLPQDMVMSLQALAQERTMSLNDLTAELLQERLGGAAPATAIPAHKAPQPPTVAANAPPAKAAKETKKATKAAAKKPVATKAPAAAGKSKIVKNPPRTTKKK